MADSTAGTHAHAHTNPEAPSSAVTRSEFLSLSTVGLGAMIGAVIGVPATAYVLAPVFEKKAFEPAFLGMEDAFAIAEEGQFKPTAASFVENPAEPETSVQLAWVHNTGNGNEDWLAADAKFVVFSNTCMHLGCPVVGSALGFSCPCHGGQYDQRGVRTAGPPIRPLDRYQWEIRGAGELWVTNRWSVDYVDGKLTYYEVKGPGQPVVVPGPEIVQENLPDILYPNVTYEYPGSPPVAG